MKHVELKIPTLNQVLTVANSLEADVNLYIQLSTVVNKHNHLSNPDWEPREPATMNTAMYLYLMEVATPLSPVANMVKRCATCGVRWQQDASLIRAYQVSRRLPRIPLCRSCAAEIGYCGIRCNWPGGCTTLVQGGVHGHRCMFHSL